MSAESYVPPPMWWNQERRELIVEEDHQMRLRWVGPHGVIRTTDVPVSMSAHHARAAQVETLKDLVHKIQVVDSVWDVIKLAETRIRELQDRSDV